MSSQALINSSAYKCPKCFFTTSKDGIIKEHVSNQRHFYYKCKFPSCNKSFSSLYTFSSHPNHGNEKKSYITFDKTDVKKDDHYFCTLCFFSSQNFEKFADHKMVKHSQNDPLTNCYISSVLINQQLHMNNPHRFNNSIKQEPLISIYPSISNRHHVHCLFYKCIMCDLWLETMIEFKEHCSSQHEAEQIPLHLAYSKKGTQIIEATLTKYVCLYCNETNYTFPENKVHFKTHKIKHQPFQYIYIQPNDDPQLVEEATFKCTICDVIPESMELIREHWTTKHVGKVFKVNKLYPENSKKFYKCEFCHKTFPYIIMRTLHTDIFHAEEMNPPQPSSPQHKRTRFESAVSKENISIKKEPQDGDLPVIGEVYSLNESTSNNSETVPPHKAVPAKRPADRYQCFYCSKSYKLFEKLQSHHQNEHATFTWFYLYNKHLENGTSDMISSNDKLYRCSYCLAYFGKSFTAFSIHYKEQHAPMPIKYSVRDGNDGFTEWKPFNNEFS